MRRGPATRLTAAQEQMFRAIAAGQSFGGRVQDLASLQRRRLIHRIGPRYWLTGLGREVLAALNASPKQKELDL